MNAEDLLQKLLEIELPWQVIHIREDLGKNQVDVWMAQQTGKSTWFFGAKTAAGHSGVEHAWRHVGLGDTRCVIHAEADTEATSLPCLARGKGTAFYARLVAPDRCHDA